MKEQAMRRTDEKEAVREMLDKLLLRGYQPNPYELRDLGLDVKYLQIITDKVKSQISHFSEFGRLRDAINPDRDKGCHLRLVEMSDLGDIPCLRLSEKRESFTGATRYEPILRLSPVEHGSDFEVELFLTWNGEWIVYPKGRSNEDTFTVHNTAKELCIRLDELAGDTHQYQYPHTYRITARLIAYVREDINKLKSNLEYRKATLTECEAIEKRFFGK
jgi:hypothetical protein